ncbi:DUF1513 domain-containing protein [Paracoccus sp. MBLB3053]|uniref:DUF1513 domain-containing protein n=1 Tax=Paracoccus aurantius TaxID=3073814 RepID=A0ABU2HVR2_9RHOB|nr:DUF1513 domain-containing protein [Paracoccus sp. MBLB3053]MDS9468827.1 DUF1513 domain-containing protein [Paracoccus sp. MBLB3053]
MTNRRTLLKGLAAATVLPVRGWAAAGAPEWVAAAMSPGGDHALHGIGASGEITFSIPLPARGHAAAAHPYRAEAVAFARRPGTFGIVLDCRSGAIIHRLTPPEGRQFNGHGAYSRDGRWLYTSEVVAEGSAGRVGLWDVRAAYARAGEWDSHGVGPHELRLLPNGHIVVANGGIRTDPQDRTPLNIDDMRPNLAVLDAEGALLSRRELPAALHQNSIRHLALLPGTIAFAMQWQGDPAEPVPLLGLARDEAALTSHPVAESEAFRMKGYAGSIAANQDMIAMTSPRGGVAMLFTAEGRHCATLERADLCGVAAASDSAFTMTDGGGAIWAAEPDGLRLRRRHALSWDNHLVTIAN